MFLSPPVSGQRHTNLFKLACEACKRHYPIELILREVKQYMKLTDLPQKRAKKYV
ncbi:primase C-terminal domain-containing protein [uncultured Bacteroides sp.]|uniref:primase C-terminal domain-containing protein n=1 Tax=uncultured Bacteroides sp. TaxID=162156 RepID=UPI0025F306A1|nr:primase C-terminal domain-containing protein [uncultured Bacteroides sp.]